MRRRLIDGFTLICVMIVIGLLVTTVALDRTPSRASSPKYTPQHIPHSSGSIEGRVLDVEGQPVFKAEVSAEPINFVKGKKRVVYTDEQGRFVIRGLKPGRYAVHAAKEADGYPPNYSAFHYPGILLPQAEVYEGQTTSDVTVAVGPKAAKLVGTVVEATTNKPIARARITLRRADNPDYLYSTTADSRYEGKIEVLVPPDPFTVEVSAPGYKRWHYHKVGAGKNKFDSVDQGDALRLVSPEIKELTIALSPDN